MFVSSADVLTGEADVAGTRLPYVDAGFGEVVDHVADQVVVIHHPLDRTLDAEGLARKVLFKLAHVVGCHQPLHLLSHAIHSHCLFNVVGLIFIICPLLCLLWLLIV